MDSPIAKSSILTWDSYRWWENLQESPIFDGKNPWVSCRFSQQNQSNERWTSQPSPYGRCCPVARGADVCRSARTVGVNASCSSCSCRAVAAVPGRQRRTSRCHGARNGDMKRPCCNCQKLWNEDYTLSIYILYVYIYIIYIYTRTIIYI